jgi:N utilization substance protein B
MSEQTKETGAGRKPGSRRAGRVLAFQALYGQGFVPQSGEAAITRAFRRNPAVAECENEAAREFALQLILGVCRHGDQLDQVIERHSQNWKIGRIAKIELSILRLAIFEMIHTDLPLKVAINEGVELSKKFGDGNSRNFINGILDAAAKSVSTGELGTSKTF